ncbi:MAG: hypothetical protein HQ574_00705 [Chloroflexi bacterium]|nr:hypothetical protein [Chloroflexota bacterium]
MDDLYQNLSGKDVFKQFPADVLAQLTEYSLLRKLSAGENLCRQGEIWPYVLLLAGGKLRWSMLSSGGKEHQLF